MIIIITVYISIYHPKWVGSAGFNIHPWSLSLGGTVHIIENNPFFPWSSSIIVKIYANTTLNDRRNIGSVWYRHLWLYITLPQKCCTYDIYACTYDERHTATCEIHRYQIYLQIIDILTIDYTEFQNLCRSMSKNPIQHQLQFAIASSMAITITPPCPMPMAKNFKPQFSQRSAASHLSKNHLSVYRVQTTDSRIW